MVGKLRCFSMAYRSHWPWVPAVRGLAMLSRERSERQARCRLDRRSWEQRPGLLETGYD